MRSLAGVNMWKLISGILLLSSVFSFLGSMKTKKALSVLKSRKTLSNEEIYCSYYEQSGLSKDEFNCLWKEISDTLKIESGKIRPTDIFGKDIGLYFITSEELDLLFEVATKRAKEMRIPVNIDSIKTVDDYIKFFSTRPIAG